MTPDAPTRPCANCDAGMQHDQDWCLECGTAAPGRLGGLRPGWRAVASTLALTVALVGGAGAASYAALSSDANREAIAAAPADGAPVAQAPPAVPAPPAPVLPPPTVDKPEVDAPEPELPKTPDVEVIAPETADAPAVITPPADDAPAGDAPADKAPAEDRGADVGDGEPDEPARDTSPMKPIALGAGVTALYDPYGRATAPGDPADAQDGDATTTFTFGAAEDGEDLQVGVVVDLKARKQVRGIEFTTSTPGADVEVYATDSSTLPPDILDTRWDHPASRPDAKRQQRIVLPRGGAKYRYVVLWFTAPAKAGEPVGVTDLDVLG